MGIIDKIKKKPAAKKPAKEEKLVVAAASTSPSATDAKKATAMSVLLRAIVTEKAAVMQSAGKYVFMVSRAATKNQVKHAIETLHNVHVNAVHLINVQGKRNTRGGSRSDFKKAIVTLPKGQTIVMHEGV